MKSKLLIVFIIISALLISISCNASADTSRYTQEQVLTIAQKLSPECRVQIVYGEGSGWCNNLPQYEETEPVFKADYMGNGIWHVDKKCSINQEWNRMWIFYEETAEMVIR